MWLNLERTLGKRSRKVEVVTRRELKRSSFCRRPLTIVSFHEKMGATPSVFAPGDTNPSDVTPLNLFGDTACLMFRLIKITINIEVALAAALPTVSSHISINKERQVLPHYNDVRRFLFKNVTRLPGQPQTTGVALTFMQAYG